MYILGTSKRAIIIARNSIKAFSFEKSHIKIKDLKKKKKERFSPY